MRLAYTFMDAGWTVAAEEYADYGFLGDLSPRHEQAHQLFGVVNHTFGTVDVDAGLGVGLTNATDRLTFKVILAHDFNRRPRRPLA